MVKSFLRFVTFMVIAFFLTLQRSNGQQLGMSFSFFFPRNGSFSIPVSPFSFRGLGVSLTRNISLETGFTLYRMSGMSVTGIPFETHESVMGPFFSLMIPGQVVLKLPLKNVVFSVKGGGFGFYNLGNRVNYGNLDRAIRDYYQWEVANADFSFDNKLGLGFIGGAELIINFTRQFGMNFAVNYLAGGSNLNLKGSFTGGDKQSGLMTLQGNYPDSRLDYNGIEVTLGVLFNTK